ncbi:MAG TPA: hypothetical protein VGO63_03435 [Candidatus Paceibacterota bacterium]|jgi:5-methylcytosine-specific restriction protein A|nr:hypothetical protein [Candidatus Paceibacterota bacterium]
MEENILKINKKFYDSLSEGDNKKVLKIYGYNSPDEFLSGVISKLNEEYSFLKINKFNFLSTEEIVDYHTYNGFISGKFVDYDLITVSFTTIKGKEGNVFMSQQVMPMITSKLKNDKKFILSNRVKKICLLTTHKSDIYSPDKNIITDSGISNIQMSVKYINTIGFDIVDIFHIKNLSTKSRYYNIDELIDHSNYLQKKNPTNSQFQQITKKDYVYSADFENEPVGQEVKFFALKLYAAVILLKGRNIHIDNALQKSNDITLQVLNDFIQYLLNIDISLYNIFKDLSEEIEYETEIDTSTMPEEAVRPKKDDSMPGHKQQPIYSFNAKGRKIYKTQRIFKKNAFEIHGYFCACHEEKHYYFTSEATNKKYVEGHHMIPMEFQDQYWKDRQINLDCTINLIPLCSHCHGKIHKSIKPERVQIITEVYNKHKDQLLTIDSKLTFDKFAELYNVYIY